MKNNLACAIFKVKNSRIFSIILRQLGKWGKYKKRYLIRKPWLFYSIVLKAS
jgi:hypothetical protein